MTAGEVPDNSQVVRALRARVAALLLAAVAIFVGVSTAYRVVNTIDRLELVERERDRWQRPAEVIQALNLKENSVVMDLGAGAGYFALRLAPVVKRGRVLAVDVRGASLFFLRLRALLRGQWNVTTVRGRAEDPHSRDAAIDAILIANTYHEFTHPDEVLAQANWSLAPDGRLVILDRAGGAEGNHHHAAEEDVESELVRAGFVIGERHPSFIDAAGRESWWLIVARKGPAGKHP